MKPLLHSSKVKFQSILKLKIELKYDKILPHLFKENSGSQFKLKGRPSLEASAGKSSLLAELSGPGPGFELYSRLASSKH